LGFGAGPPYATKVKGKLSAAATAKARRALCAFMQSLLWEISRYGIGISLFQICGQPLNCMLTVYGANRAIQDNDLLEKIFTNVL